MRLLIRPLMPRPKPASRLYPGPEKSIFDALEVNNPSKKMTRTLETLKRISFPRILLLIRHQVRLNPHRHSPIKTRIVILAKKNHDNKVKAKIFLPLASMLLLSGSSKIRIRRRKTYLILSAILVSKNLIMLISVPRRSQKTSVGLDDLYIDD